MHTPFISFSSDLAHHLDDRHVLEFFPTLLYKTCWHTIRDSTTYWDSPEGVQYEHVLELDSKEKKTFEYYNANDTCNDTYDGKQQVINIDVSVGNVQMGLLGTRRVDNNHSAWC